MPGFERPSAELVARSARLPTSSVSDALDQPGRPGQVDGLRPMLAGARVRSPAVTPGYMPVGVGDGTVGDFPHLVEVRRRHGHHALQAKGA